MEKRKKVLLILGLCIFTLALVGLSYAFWVITLQQDDENDIATACLDIELMPNAGKGITLNPGYPILDSEGEALDPYTFSIHNKCQDNLRYQVNLEIINTSTLNKKYIKVKLNEENEPGTIQYLTNAVDPTLTTGESIADEAYKLETGYLTNNETKSFEFRQWMDGDIEGTEVDSMNKIFKSKITIIATYLTEDKLPPNPTLELSTEYSTIIASGGVPESTKEVSKYEYQLNDGNWEEGEETYRFYGLPNGSYTVGVRITDTDGFVSEVTTQSTQIEGVEKTQTINGKEIALTNSGNGLYEVTHEDVADTIKDDAFTTTEYRFGSENPSNYVWFNNELWRIIGLVNVMTSEDTVEQRVKIVKDTPYKESTNFQIGDEETMKNFWWGTIENKIDLNTNYYNSLESTAKNMIDEDLYWNVGWIIEYDMASPNNASEYYNIERGNNVHDSVPYLWHSTENEKARIGIMYSSDYGYAVGGEENNRSTCVSEAIDNWSNNCYDANWLYNSENHIATMTFLTMTLQDPSLEYSNSYFGFMSADCKSDSCGELPMIQPAVYLKSNVKIGADGKTTGSRTNPFTLSIE